MRTDSIHAQAGRFMLPLTWLCHRINFDAYDFEKEQITEDQGSLTSLAYKTGINLVAPIVLSYAIAAAYNTVEKRKKQQADAKAADDLFAATEAQDAAAIGARRYSTSFDEYKIHTLDDHDQAKLQLQRGLVAVGFNFAITMIPLLVQMFDKNPNHKTVSTLEDIFSLNPAVGFLPIAVALGVTPLAYRKEYNIHVTTAAYFTAATLSALVGPLLLIPAIATHNPNLLKELGKVMPNWGMFALSTATPMLIAVAKTLTIAEKMQTAGITADSGYLGLASTIAVTNFITQCAFGNLAGILRLENDMQDAEVAGKLGVSLAATAGLIAASTAVAFVGYSIFDKARTCINDHRAAQADRHDTDGPFKYNPM